MLSGTQAHGRAPGLALVAQSGGAQVPARSGFAKLALDKVFAAAALVALTPLMAGIALAIYLSEGGPVIFRHWRMGQGGRPFPCLKFRTMSPDGDRKLDEVLRIDPIARSEWLSERKLFRDPRVGRLGRFLRRSSLDELPQLWNVLCGDMSLVGPRPIVEDEVPLYGSDYAYYTAVRPGLTGIWQVAGRGVCSYEERVALDVDYVRGQTIGGDVRILARTVGAVLSGRGAA
ncbi:MAG: sugar transferase [Tranquillimonas sp.]|jgi:exopolysaccharide production protein ExoY